MKDSFLALVLFLSAPLIGSGQDALPANPAATWNTYSNAKYGYEIRYPDGFELWPTGPKGRRDGARIRIALAQHQAPAPVLDVYVGQGVGDTGHLPEAGLRDLDVAVEEVEVGGAPAREVTYRWKENGEIAFVEVRQPNVLFRLAAGPGLGDFAGTTWWRIVSTFRIRRPS